MIGYTPPLVTYPSVLLGLYWVYMPPLFAVFGLAWLWWTRREAAARFITVVVLLNLAIYALCLFMGARFIAPAALLLTVASGAGVAVILRSLGPMLSGSSTSQPSR